MKKKVLVIDDEEMIRKLMTDILNQTGYEPLSAADGASAVALLEQNRVDLIILDMNMPQMDGLEFLHYTNEHRLTHAPVLMFSGMSDKETMLECYGLGVYDFIKKSEQLEIMLKRIENGLKIGEMIHFNEFMRVELETARKFQKYLYPESALSAPGIEMAVHIQLMSGIGGDLYDYIKFMDGRIIFFVADVSGHSISAAMYTAMVKMMFRKALKESEKPGDILTRLNREVSENLPVESFITIFCGLLDPAGKTLHYANGGHPRPYIFTGGKAAVLEGHDSFLGPIKDAKFITFTANTTAWDGMIVFTDGIFDIRGGGNGFDSEEGLERHMKDGTLSIREKFNLIKGAITDPNALVNDDCTVVMIELKGQ